MIISRFFIHDPFRTCSTKIDYIKFINKYTIRQCSAVCFTCLVLKNKKCDEPFIMPFNNDAENEFKIIIEINQRVEHIMHGWFLISIMNIKL